VHVLRGHRLDRHAIQVVALLAGGHRIEVAGRARMQAERDLEVFFLEVVGVQGQQLLVDAELERPEAGPEHLRIELEQALQHRDGLARRALAALGLGRGLRRGVGLGLGPGLAPSAAAFSGGGGCGRRGRRGGGLGGRGGGNGLCRRGHRESWSAKRGGREAPEWHLL
jgi:hypothetical protein